MFTKNEIEDLLAKVFQKMAGANQDNSNDHMDFETWEWPVGVGLYGLYKYYRGSGKPEYRDLMIRWYERRLAAGLPAKNVNTVAPLLTLACLCEEEPRPEFLNICREWAEWIVKEMPRTEEGGLQHITAVAENREQLWDDTLFMTVLFLTKMAVLTGDPSYRDEAVYQFLLHIKYLTDLPSGLWYHGWSFEGRHHFGKLKWARGNSWFTAGVVEFLEISGLEGPVREYLLTALRAQVKTLAALQDATGLWHTLLDDASSYLEASAAAGFGYGILKGACRGYLAPQYRETGMKAARGVIGCIAADGTVNQVSYGTAIGASAEHYKSIPICPTAYGQALTIMLLAEMLDKVD